MNDLERAGLGPLDPGRDDPGYWHSFHREVMARAAPELARRRSALSSSVTDVVFGWRRALVPLALMAAALSGLLLVWEVRTAAAPVPLEEVLVSGVEGDPIPVALAGGVSPDPGSLPAGTEGY